MKIYHCEDSLEGIFTAIYNTYEDHCIIRDTMVTTIEENLLFSESVEVIPDPEKTVKVIRTLSADSGKQIMRPCVWHWHRRSRRRHRRYTGPLRRDWLRSVRRGILWMPLQTPM